MSALLVSPLSLSLSLLPPLFLSSFTVTTHRPRLRTDSSTFLRVFVPFQVSGTRCEVNLENNRSKEIRGRLSSASNSSSREERLRRVREKLTSIEMRAINFHRPSRAYSFHGRQLRDERRRLYDAASEIPAE
jgi:hypothetical protein